MCELCTAANHCQANMLVRQTRPPSKLCQKSTQILKHAAQESPLFFHLQAFPRRGKHRLHAADVVHLPIPRIALLLPPLPHAGPVRRFSAATSWRVDRQSRSPRSTARKFSARSQAQQETSTTSRVLLMICPFTGVHGGEDARYCCCTRVGRSAAALSVCTKSTVVQ